MPFDEKRRTLRKQRTSTPPESVQMNQAATKESEAETQSYRERKKNEGRSQRTEKNDAKRVKRQAVYHGRRR